MPKYTANAYLVHHGKVVQTGNELELTEEQAERLGDKVTLIESEDVEPLEEQTVPALKEIAKSLEVEGYGDMKKAELIEAITAKQE